MAEGFLRTFYGNHYEAYSAGIKPASISSYAVEVMKELGIDLSTHWSKSIIEFKEIMFDYVVTVCNNAKEVCQFFPGKYILYKEFNNTSLFNGNVEETLAMFWWARDEIKERAINTFG
jgi:arsenate reductase